MALCKVCQYRLDAFFLVLTQCDAERRDGGWFLYGRRDLCKCRCASGGDSHGGCKSRTPDEAQRIPGYAEHKEMMQWESVALVRNLRVVTVHYR